MGKSENQEDGKRAKDDHCGDWHGSIRRYEKRGKRGSMNSGGLADVGSFLLFLSLSPRSSCQGTTGNSIII